MGSTKNGPASISAISQLQTLTPLKSTEDTVQSSQCGNVSGIDSQTNCLEGKPYSSLLILTHGDYRAAVSFQQLVIFTGRHTFQCIIYIAGMP